MAGEVGVGKRKRGRPSVHGGETTVIGFRVAKHRAVRINGLLAAIKLADQRTDDLDSDVLMEALEHRLQGLANRNLQIVERALRSRHRWSPNHLGL